LLIPGFTEALTLVLDLALANTIINHALGSRDQEPLNRGLTEAENSVLTTALNEYLPDLAAAFDHAITPPELSLVSSPDATIDQAISPSATFVAFSAEVALGENSPGRLTIGYLGSMLKPLLAAYAQKQSGRPLNFARLSNTLLSKVTVPVLALLGETTLTTNDLRQLEVGDVVTLATAINAALPIKIGKLLTLLGQPGTKDKKISLRLADLAAEELIIESPPLESHSPTAAERPATAPPPTSEPPPAAALPPVESTDLLDEEFSDKDFEDLFDEEDDLEAKEEK
jgi:flagellar motor switch protein FliM